MSLRRTKFIAAVLSGIVFLTGCGSAFSPGDTWNNPIAAEAVTEAPDDRALSDGAVEGTEAAEDAEEVADAAPDKVIDDYYGTTYEIFVGSFADSNGDGIGDLNGIRERLDYLNDGDPASRTDLGVNALWLTPVFPSPTYHKYDATDYCSVDPAFGTLADLDALLEACHNRGIRLYLDLAFNHTSDRHFWFTDAVEAIRQVTASEGEKRNASEPPSDEEDRAFLAKAEESSPYVSYYHFTRTSQKGFEPLAGTDWYYEARFWSGMPDLDLDNARVRQELSNILGYWLRRGVDGFRLDAVTSYYTEDHARSAEFLAWLSGTADRLKRELGKSGSEGEDPEETHVYLVGEAWENQQAYATFYETGVDSFFDFAFAGQEGQIAQIVRSGKNGMRFAEQMAAEEMLYASYLPPDGERTLINAPFYTNHDMARSAGYYAKDAENRTKLAYALNLLQTGNAFVYYGEELGMKGSGKDENKRAPFPWKGDLSEPAGEKDDGTQQTPVWLSEADHAVCEGPAEMDSFESAPYGSLAEQQADPSSVYRYCREAIHLRARNPLIPRGRTVLFEENSEMGKELAGHPAICGFRREAAENGSTENTEALWIYVNTAAEEQTISLFAEGADSLSLTDSLTAGEEPVRISRSGSEGGDGNGTDGDILTLPGYAIAILKP